MPIARTLASIHDNKRLETLQRAARKFHAAGFAVVSLAGKITTVKWKQKPQLKIVLNNLNRFSNIGILTKFPVRGLYVFVLDFDSIEGYEKFKARLADLSAEHMLQTRIVMTSRGVHIYFKHPWHFCQKNWSDKKGNEHPEFGNLDFCSNGMVVVPPSLKKDGTPYDVVSDLPVRQITGDDVDILKACDFPMSTYAEENEPISAAGKARKRTKKSKSADALPFIQEIIERPRFVSAKLWRVFQNGCFKDWKPKFRFDVLFCQHLAGVGFTLERVLDLYERGAHQNNRYREKYRGAHYIEQTYAKALANRRFQAILAIRESVILSEMNNRRKRILIALLDICARTDKDKIRASNRELVEATGVSGKTVTKIIKEFATAKLLTRHPNGRYLSINVLWIYQSLTIKKPKNIVAAMKTCRDFSESMRCEKHREKHVNEREKFKEQRRVYFADSRRVAVHRDLESAI